MNMKRMPKILVLAALVSLGAEADSVVDRIQFGNQGSEREHDLDTYLSREIEGGLGEPARRLLPSEGRGWRGGRITFEMKVDPDQPNYFTAKFWGDETASDEQYESRLCLFINGKQVGQRHLGDVEMLDIMWHRGPRYPGRFFYKTVPLPFNITKGETSVELTIEGQGGINGYASEIERYQKMLIEPSRGIYRAYVHTSPCLEPPADEVQGTKPTDIPIRTAPGPELLDRLKGGLNRVSSKVMRSSKRMHVETLQYLAHAYCTPWNTAYKNPRAIERIVEGLDGHYLDYREDPESIIGKRWIHKGPAGDAVRMVHRELKPYLDTCVPGTKTPRGKAWAEVFIESRNYNAARRRFYTNQSMIADANIYYCNLAARLLGSSKAWPEKKARCLLYESMGLEPWSGSWNERARPEWPKGKSTFLLTPMGLTKELGYVGAYGEVVGSGVEIYEATRPSPEKEGDPRLKKQLIKMTRARAPFRYPLVDKEGCRSMNLESIIGWRDWKYPGIVVYDQVGAFDAAISTGDPVLMGYAQQILEDNQFFAKLEERMARSGSKTRTYQLAVPERYEIIASLPEQPYRLPMTDGQPDFVFADTDDGVIAFKDRDDIFYVSLYWRARSAVNNLARVHYLTPTIERDATVHIETRFNDSGKTFTIPDWTNMGFGRHGRAEDWYAEQGMHLAVAGQKQPIAKVSNDDKMYEVGLEHPEAGKAQLYLLNYGPYYIAMNCTDKKTFTFDLPAAFRGSKDLVSGQTCNRSKVPIRPRQTIVFCREP